MNLKFIDEELTTLGLKMVSLNVLHPDEESYSVLLNQYKGELIVSETFIGNSNETHELAIAKFDGFFKIAISEKFDLVACPEYSCPWNSIQNNLKKDIFPDKGKVWIIAMESITPVQLKKLISEHTNLVWIFENSLLNEQQEKTLLDSVCIFFKAIDNNNKVVNACVIQFKNQHMSVHTPGLREKDVLIEGKVLYVFRNEGATINLLTLLCSDSLKYVQTDILNKGLEKLLLVHLQMNLEPRHSVFKHYRNEIFNAESNTMEVLCLNWAKDSKVLSEKIKFSGTSYFTKSDKLILSDERINKNQDFGLFYTSWKVKRSHLYFYPSSESLHCFSTHKVSQALEPTPALRKREGPIANSSYIWNGKGSQYEKESDVNKEFAKYCVGFNSDLTPLDELASIDKERLIKLSSATNLSESCFEISQFDNFIVDDVESIKRLTYVDEVDSSIIQAKQTAILNFKELVNIFNNQKQSFPQELASLVNETKVSYSKVKHPFINIYKDGQPVGTVIYIGPSVKDLVEETYDYLTTLIVKLNQKKSIADNPLIIIWFTDNGLKSYYRSSNTIDSDTSETNISISKEL